MAKLIDITGKVISGEWGNDDDAGTGIPVLRTTNFTNDGVVNYNNVVTRDIQKKDLSQKYLQPGDIIIEKSGGSDKQPVGRVVYYDGEPNRYLFNNFTGVLRIRNQDVWYPRYVFYALYGNYAKGGTRRYENKTTGLHNLKTDQYVQDFVIQEQTLEYQQLVVSRLDKVSELIALRKEQLAKLDQLVKSRFIELFGDRYTNDKKWDNKPLYECADFYNGKAHEQVVDENGEYILVTSRCIASDIFDYRRTNALLFPLQVNDIAMVMSDVPNGRALAKCILIDEDGKYTLNQRICCLRNYSFNPVFFYHLLNRHEYFLGFNDGNAQTNLRKDDLLACNIIIPPLELQNRFASFVEQTNKSKLAIQQSLDKLELLKKSLMQEYFG